MLIKCPECELQVSDKAIACPHCGYPLRPEAKPQYIRNKTNKRRRLPNGFGQISEIKNRNLRKPFRAMITVGKTETGRPICKPLKPKSFFETYNDAYSALVEYNKSPYDLSDSITVKELYEKWFDEYSENLKSESSIRAFKSCWSYCSSIYTMKVRDVRIRHIKGCIENGFVMYKGKEKRPTSIIKSKIKTMFNLMFDYAVEYEITDRNYARAFTLSKEIVNESRTAKQSHINFTDEELNVLWDNLYKIDCIDVVLIQCYSGWRPQEICLLKIEDIDLKNSTMTGGMKTKAGKNRIVPIHSKIRPLIERRYKEAVALESKYLFNTTNQGAYKLNLTYSKYQKRFYTIREKLNINPDHRPHDCRTTFVTNAKKFKVDEYAIKYIVGHEINDITEKVYTKRDITWLKEEIEKIKV